MPINFRNDDPITVDELRSDAAQLARRIDEVINEWDAGDEVDTTLGVEIQETGIAVAGLLTDIAKVTNGSDPDHTRELLRESADLDETTEFYEQLTEHDTNASIDIFDKLGPGIALAYRVLAALETPDTDQEPTNGDQPCSMNQTASDTHSTETNSAR